jgi:DNA-binding NarL/FixJ family response regulator
MSSPATGSSPLKILVVDADRRVRDSLSDLICCEVGLEAVASVGTADDARAAVADSRPDIVIIDPRLPELDAGMTLLDEFRADHPEMRLLVMGWSNDNDVAGHAEHDTRAVRPIHETLDKSASPEDILAAIAHSVRKGASK